MAKEAIKNKIMLFNPLHIKKYDKPGPRYTSYPPANFFVDGFSKDEMTQQIVHSNMDEPHNVSFYFHVPFCPQLCHFCGCNTELMRQKNFVERYFEAMKKEFNEVAKLIDKSRPVTQIHWGGGTPNSVPLRIISEVMSLVKSQFEFTPNADVAMECNPTHLTHKQVDELAEMGFNRISIGIQDFDLKVLDIINRRPSKLPVQEIVSYIQSKGIHVNLDFVYGLPGQTVESFSETIRQAVAIQPERIVTFSYAHVPWVKSAQKILEQYEIPEPTTKMLMYESAFQIITEAGYDPIGLDHFAKPNDQMALALKNRSLHRNFMGYCTKTDTGQVYAFGATSITQLDGAYIQNIKNTEKYVETIEQHEFAPEKGYILSDRDKICRIVIEELMCNHYIDLNKISSTLLMNIHTLIERMHFEEIDLQPFIDDELVTWNNYQLSILPQGKLFLRNIAMLFDPLQKESNATLRYSKTV
jgi:oxygen-independent coproporphyrinogen III oxidase